jgi:ribosome-binding protein aMBF1 (putative translation factor)
MPRINDQTKQASVPAVHGRTFWSMTNDLTEESGEAFVPIESTGYWREMEKNRVGNLLAGARLKAGLTQAQLADKLGIRQNMVSDYERGRRTFSAAMARRLSKTLKVKEERL